MNWNTPAPQEIIEKVSKALTANGFNTLIVQTGEEAKAKALELIPQGAEVMTMTSNTTDSIGLSKELNESGKYNSVKAKLASMDRKTHNSEMQKLGAAADYSVGSVHAVTEDGHVLIASNSGSQLPGYVYGSPQVLWIVGSQKVVKNIDAGTKRIYEYILPKESVRARKAYGLPDDWNSFVSKLVIYNKEPNAGRITIILVKEALGY